MARRRVWLPFTSNTDTYDTLATGSSVLLAINSIVNVELGMELSQMTTRRLIFTATLGINAVDAVISIGVSFRPEVLTAAQGNQPGSNPAATWQFWEQMLIDADATVPTRIHRDVAISRRALGSESELEIQLQNQSAGTISWHLTGRVLVLLA